MRFENYLQPWIFALIGGLLILGASSLSGVLEYRKQLDFENIKNDIALINNNIESNQFYYQSATLKSDLGYIQEAVDRIQQSKTGAQTASLHATHIKTGIFYLYAAIKKPLTDKQAAKINELAAKAGAGDNKSYLELQTISTQLTLESGKYLTDLWKQKAIKENQANKLSKESTNIRIVSVIFQLLGLVLLLLKELPVSLWRKRQPM